MIRVVKYSPIRNGVYGLADIVGRIILDRERVVVGREWAKQDHGPGRGEVMEVRGQTLDRRDDEQETSDE
jgi:hypothetical protein